ncbi:hypothetical protein A8G00_09930 [Sphingobium sp. SA916]|nr:hypothetical protein A8G00_09930 [Sphingobium sp. SA916]
MEEHPPSAAYHIHSATVSIAADNSAPAAPSPAMTAGMNHHGGRRRDDPVLPRLDLLRVMKRLLFPDGGLERPP